MYSLDVANHLSCRGMGLCRLNSLNIIEMTLSNDFVKHKLLEITRGLGTEYISENFI